MQLRTSLPTVLIWASVPRPWPLALAVVALLLALPPVLLLSHAWDSGVWREADRLIVLAGNTTQLTLGTLLLTGPAGLILAVLLYRSDLPGRGFWQGVVITGLFVPLPLLASAWQAALGTGGWLPLDIWRTVPPDAPEWTSSVIPYKPWAVGLPAALWVHAMAGLPWIVWLTGSALRRANHEIEDTALTFASPVVVLWRVVVPAALPTFGLAMLWVALMTASEIVVTDMFQVRTFAEEVYTQFVSPESTDSLGRAMTLTLPSMVIMGLLVSFGVSRSGLTASGPERLLWRLGFWRWPAVLAIGLCGAVVVGVPVGGLVYKAGGGEAFQVETLLRKVGESAGRHGGIVVRSLAAAGLAGIVTASLALACVWPMQRSRLRRGLLLTLVAVLWAIPAPVLGLGIKEAIERIIDVEELLGISRGPARQWLYDGPSVLPIVWAYVARFWPGAVVLLGIAIRTIPSELSETVRTMGARPSQELWYVVAPLLSRAWLLCVAVVAVLSLGELSASKLVETPGGQTLIHEIFTQMHYGVTTDLAGLCLVQLFVMLAGVGLIGIAGQSRH